VTRVLVTGGSGFFGAAAIAALHGFGEVHAVARTPPESSAPGVTWHAIDLLDPEAARSLIKELRPTHLLHFAWNARPGQFWAAKDNLDWVAATLMLYRAFADAGGTRFVGAGTCAEYDWSRPEHVEDQTPLAPATLYGRAKSSTFQLLGAASAQDGVAFAWGRIYFVYGPGEQRGRLVSDIACELLSGGSPKCSEGLQQRDFMHIADYGRAFAALLQSEVQGAVNIASGECRSVRSVVEAIATQIGRPDAPQFGARPSPPHDPPRMSANVGRLRDEVGFRPVFSLEAGVADTIAWWRRKS
jgi:nucleoside-diphosphate-sugar epimerase